MDRDILNEKLAIDVIIPAYNANFQGLAVRLAITAIPSSHLRIISRGIIAQSLEKSFLRVIQIAMSLKNSWSCLEKYRYVLQSFEEGYIVKDVRSADLSICIAAMNIIRARDKKKLIDNYIGTGSLRVDGSFNETFLEEVKEQAIHKTTARKQFITTKSCNHIFDLEALFEGC